MRRKTPNNSGKENSPDETGRVAYFPSAKNSPSDRKPTDEELAARTAEGDRAAYAEIVRRHARKFYAFAFRYLANQQEAEDIVQTALLKFWQRPHLWDASRGARFSTWFYQIILNACRDALRTRGKIVPLFEDGTVAESDHDTPEEALIRKDVLHYLQRLPERQHQAVLLCFYEGMTHSEAAAVMGTTQKSVELLVRRAKSALKEMMEEDSEKHRRKGGGHDGSQAE